MGRKILAVSFDCTSVFPRSASERAYGKVNVCRHPCDAVSAMR